MTSSDMTSPTYRTLKMKQLIPNYLSSKFHDHDIFSLEFTGHSLHPSFPKNKLKCKKNRSNPGAELMGVPLRVEYSPWKIHGTIKCRRTSKPRKYLSPTVCIWTLKATNIIHIVLMHLLSKLSSSWLNKEWTMIYFRKWKVSIKCGFDQKLLG